MLPNPQRKSGYQRKPYIARPFLSAPGNQMQKKAHLIKGGLFHC
nr:MAG TPA_asm: hypothetical protein [Caudoviricetes sp.]